MIWMGLSFKQLICRCKYITFLGQYMSLGKEISRKKGKSQFNLYIMTERSAGI